MTTVEKIPRFFNCSTNPGFSDNTPSSLFPSASQKQGVLQNEGLLTYELFQSTIEQCSLFLYYFFHKSAYWISLIEPYISTEGLKGDLLL